MDTLLVLGVAATSVGMLALCADPLAAWLAENWRWVKKRRRRL